jgi:hypothetical protein
VIAPAEHEFAAYLATVEPAQREQVVKRTLVRSDTADDMPEAGAGLLAKRVDLGTLLRDGIPPVEDLPGEFARRLVYKVGVTGFSGHPESGKTTLVCRLALDAMRHGRHAVYFDYENGEQEAARRFLALGADADLLSEFLVYLPFPGAPNWTQIGALWDESRRPSLSGTPRAASCARWGSMRTRRHRSERSWTRSWSSRSAVRRALSSSTM